MFGPKTLLHSLIGIPFAVHDGARFIGNGVLQVWKELKGKGREVEAAQLKQIKQFAEGIRDFPESQRRKVVQQLDKALPPEKLMPLKSVHELRRDVEDLERVLEELRASLDGHRRDKAA